MLRARRIAAFLLVVAVVTVLIPASRRGILRAAGRSLVAEDPLASADVIVVAVDAGHAGLLQAADLVHQGMAGRVALLAQDATPEEREFARRGVAYESPAAASARYLRLLGVPDVERIPSSVDGTQAEGPALLEWCTRQQLKSVIVVSSADHSRRLRRVLRRSMRGSPVHVRVRPSRFSSFDPDSWWLTRTGRRMQLVETEKLLLDIATHPLW